MATVSKDGTWKVWNIDGKLCVNAVDIERKYTIIYTHGILTLVYVIEYARVEMSHFSVRH